MEKSLENILHRALEITNDSELKQRIQSALSTEEETLISTMEEEVKDGRMVLDHLELLEKQLEEIDALLVNIQDRMMGIRKSALVLCANAISKQ